MDTFLRPKAFNPLTSANQCPAPPAVSENPAKAGQNFSAYRGDETGSEDAAETRKAIEDLAKSLGLNARQLAQGLKDIESLSVSDPNFEIRIETLAQVLGVSKEDVTYLFEVQKFATLLFYHQIFDGRSATLPHNAYLIHCRDESNFSDQKTHEIEAEFFTQDNQGNFSLRHEKFQELAIDNFPQGLAKVSPKDASLYKNIQDQINQVTNELDEVIAKHGPDNPSYNIAFLTEKLKLLQLQQESVLWKYGTSKKGNGQSEIDDVQRKDLEHEINGQAKLVGALWHFAKIETVNLPLFFDQLLSRKILLPDGRLNSAWEHDLKENFKLGKKDLKDLALTNPKYMPIASAYIHHANGLFQNQLNTFQDEAMSAASQIHELENDALNTLLADISDYQGELDQQTEEDLNEAQAWYEKAIQNAVQDKDDEKAQNLIVNALSSLVPSRIQYAKRFSGKPLLSQIHLQKALNFINRIQFSIPENAPYETRLIYQGKTNIMQEMLALPQFRIDGDPIAYAQNLITPEKAKDWLHGENIKLFDQVIKANQATDPQYPNSLFDYADQITRVKLVINQITPEGYQEAQTACSLLISRLEEASKNGPDYLKPVYNQMELDVRDLKVRVLISQANLGSEHLQTGQGFQLIGLAEKEMKIFEQNSIAYDFAQEPKTMETLNQLEHLVMATQFTYDNSLQNILKLCAKRFSEDPRLQEKIKQFIQGLPEGSKVFVQIINTDHLPSNIPQTESDPGASLLARLRESETTKTWDKPYAPGPQLVFTVYDNDNNNTPKRFLIQSLPEKIEVTQSILSDGKALYSNDPFSWFPNHLGLNEKDSSLENPLSGTSCLTDGNNDNGFFQDQYDRHTLYFPQSMQSIVEITEENLSVAQLTETIPSLNFMGLSQEGAKGVSLQAFLDPKLDQGYPSFQAYRNTKHFTDRMLSSEKSPKENSFSLPQLGSHLIGQSLNLSSTLLATINGPQGVSGISLPSSQEASVPFLAFHPPTPEMDFDTLALNFEEVAAKAFAYAKNPKGIKPDELREVMDLTFQYLEAYAEKASEEGLDDFASYLKNDQRSELLLAWGQYAFAHSDLKEGLTLMKLAAGDGISRKEFRKLNSQSQLILDPKNLKTPIDALSLSTEQKITNQTALSRIQPLLENDEVKIRDYIQAAEKLKRSILSDPLLKSLHDRLVDPKSRDLVFSDEEKATFKYLRPAMAQLAVLYAQGDRVETSDKYMGALVKCHSDLAEMLDFRFQQANALLEYNGEMTLDRLNALLLTKIPENISPALQARSEEFIKSMESLVLDLDYIEDTPFVKPEIRNGRRVYQIDTREGRGKKFKTAWSKVALNEALRFGTVEDLAWTVGGMAAGAGVVFLLVSNPAGWAVAGGIAAGCLIATGVKFYKNTHWEEGSQKRIQSAINSGLTRIDPQEHAHNMLFLGVDLGTSVIPGGGKITTAPVKFGVKKIVGTRTRDLIEGGFKKYWRQEIISAARSFRFIKPAGRFGNARRIFRLRNMPYFFGIGFPVYSFFSSGNNYQAGYYGEEVLSRYRGDAFSDATKYGLISHIGVRDASLVSKSLFLKLLTKVK